MTKAAERLIAAAKEAKGASEATLGQCMLLQAGREQRPPFTARIVLDAMAHGREYTPRDMVYQMAMKGQRYTVHSVREPLKQLVELGHVETEYLKGTTIYRRVE